MANNFDGIDPSEPPSYFDVVPKGDYRNNSHLNDCSRTGTSKDSNYY